MFVAVLFLFGVIVADKQRIQAHTYLIEVISCACCKDEIHTQIELLKDEGIDNDIGQLEQYLSHNIDCKASYSMETKAIETEQYGEFVVPNGVYKCVRLSFGQANGIVYKTAFVTAKGRILLHPAVEKGSFFVRTANHLRFCLLEQLGMLDYILFESSAVNSS